MSKGVKLVVVGLAIVLGGCSAGSSEVGMTDDLRFDPAMLTVEAGTTVTFVNESDQPHTVTAYEDEVPEGEFFSSGGFSTESAARDGISDALITSGESFDVTLDTPGTYRYFCIPHEQQGMKGTLVVE